MTLYISPKGRLTFRGGREAEGCGVAHDGAVGELMSEGADGGLCALGIAFETRYIVDFLTGQ